MRNLKLEFSKQQIEYFRNNIKPQKIKIKFENKIQEPLDMLFKDAANIYFNRLKTDNKIIGFPFFNIADRQIQFNEAIKTLI